MNLQGVKQSGIFVYGTGNFARDLISRFADLEISVQGVFDHHGIGTYLETDAGTFEVFDSANLRAIANIPVALGIHNLHGDLHSIAANLRAINSSLQIISPVQTCRFFHSLGILFSNYWLTSNFELYQEQAEEIAIFRNLLADSISKTLFSSIIKYRSSGDLLELPHPHPLKKQYIADDLATPPKNLRIVDLGACQGENLEFFIGAGRKFEDGFLFEPDISNLKKLNSKVNDLGLYRLKTFQLGAWHESTTLKFDASGNPAASFSEDGSSEIEVVSLDEFIPQEFRPNFIKMDIEGAELSALKGMRKLIRNHSPHLAISAYHKPQDLWELGNYLESTHPGTYRFHLRMYGHQTFDTILYAVPLRS